MNDQELDEILNQWSAPPAPPSLRDRVRAGFPKPPRHAFRWRRGFTTAAVIAAAAILLIVTQASPQPVAPIPWTVDSEFIRYADDGSSAIEMYSTSYESESNETVLSRSIPGSPLKTALAWTADVVIPFHNRVIGRLVLGSERLEQIQKAKARNVGFVTGCGLHPGCMILEHAAYAKAATGCIEGEIVDRATILNYPTEAVRERWTEHGRMTIWMAPALGCFALKVTREEERPDGTYRLVAAKQAIKVNVSP
jgi:hypothetical protein